MVQPAINGTEERLDLILEELRAWRDSQPSRPQPPEGTVELREPARQQPRQQRRKGIHGA